MSWHPLLLSVFVADAAALGMLLAAAVTSLRVVLGWSPGSAARAQILLEVRAESASVLGRAALWLFLLATLLLLVAITAVLPEMVPGAMCAKGVLQATGGAGARGLWLRGLALAALSAWHLLDRLDRSQPRSPLATGSARTMLLAVPLAVIAVVATFEAAQSLDVHRPVDCCALVYGQVRAAGTGQDSPLPHAVWLGLWMGTGILLLCLAGLAWRSGGGRGQPRRAAALAALSLLWVPVSSVTLLRVLAAYHYGVLHHHCPWCLLLPEHLMVGYPMFAALAAVALEGPAGFIAARIGQKVPELRNVALRRSRLAALRVLVASAGFILLAGLPPVLWRIRFGVWMS